MKENRAPIKIYLNPDAVPHNQSGKFLFIHNSDVDESKCTIEYTRTDAFIEKAAEWFDKTLRDTDFYENEIELFIKEFKKAMML